MILAYENPEFKILTDLKILAFQNPEFKIFCRFENFSFAKSLVQDLSRF